MADEQRTIGLTLKYDVDEPSLRRAQASVNQAAGDPLSSQREAALKAFNTQITELSTRLEGMGGAKFNRNLDASLQSMRRLGPEMINGARSSAQLEREMEYLTGTLSDVQDGLNTVGQSAGKAETKLDRLSRLGMTGFQLQMAAMPLQRLGDSLLTPITAAVDKMGEVNPNVMRWVQAQESIGDSTARIGSVMISQVLPTMEKFADLAERAADFIEKYPEIAKAIVGIGVGSAGFAKLLSGFASALSIVSGGAVLAQMAGGAGGAAAAGGVGAAAAGGIAAAVTAALPVVIPAAIAAAALYVGNKVYEEKKQPGQEGMFAEARDSIGKLQTIGTLAFNKLTDDLGLTDGAARRTAEAVSEHMRAVQAEEEALKNANQVLGITEQKLESATKIYSDFLDQEQKAAEQYTAEVAQANQEYEKQRTDAVNEYGKRRAELEQQYERERTQLVADYARERARAEEDYQRERQQYIDDYNRTTAEFEAEYAQERADAQAEMQQQLSDLTADYHESVQDAAEEHQKRLEDLERDHQYRVEDLVIARDALGLALENRRYADEKASANREYQEKLRDLKQQFQAERAETLQSYRQRLAEMDRQHAEESAKRQEEYQRRLAEMEEEYNLEKERRAQDHAERMKELQANHQLEMQQLKRDFNDEMQQMAANHQTKLAELAREYNQEKQQRSAALRTSMQELLGIEKQGYADMKAAAQEYVDQLLEEKARLEGVAGSGSLAYGGYASFGRYMLGDAPGGRMPGMPEYVINGPTTKALEKLVGGRITNQNLVNLGKAGSKVANASISLTINGSNMDERKLARLVETHTYRAMRKALE